MATISDAIRAGVLDEFALPAHEVRKPLRPLLAAPEFFDWWDETPALLDNANKSGARTLHEHVEQMLCDLRCSAKPSGGDLRRTMPTKNGVWTVRPPKLRLYGWFHKRGEFVAIAGALESETKLIRSLNDDKRDAVLAFASRHGLLNTMLKGDLRAILP